MICKHNGCKTIASFNYKGCDKRIYCSKHKLDNMENVRWKLCAYDDCRNKRLSNNLYCRNHSSSTEIKVVVTLLLSLKKLT